MSGAPWPALDISYLGLISSVIMDSDLWMARGYLVPCWTMAAISAGVICLFQMLKRQSVTDGPSDRLKGT